MKQNNHDPVIGIGTLAKRVGLSISAIRKYEDEGLIIAHRAESGHRMFSYEDITRIEVIRHLIKTLGFNIEGIRRMQALLPCWDLFPCDKYDSSVCSAHSNSSHPCWLIKDAHCTLQGNECRDCIVYRFGSLCTENIKELLHHQNEGSEIKNVMSEILERKLAV